jgi:hypothetical protein
MNYADKFVVESLLGRLRAVECALQSMILSHPDPGAFGESLDGLLESIEARSTADAQEVSPRESESFREACGALRRAAAVALANPSAAI